jgi:hypothetical protein
MPLPSPAVSAVARPAACKRLQTQAKQRVKYVCSVDVAADDAAALASCQRGGQAGSLYAVPTQSNAELPCVYSAGAPPEVPCSC